jgi:hypothetical protein
MKKQIVIIKIFIYQENIKDFARHVCYYCQRLYFKYQICVASKSDIEQFLHELKNAITMQDVLICNSCKKILNLEIPFDFVLRNHIMDNKLNMKFLSMLNKIEKCLIAPHLSFTQIFQLQKCGQYEFHGNIVNVPTNLNII